MKITTNHHWRDFKFRYEVPANVLNNELDWTDEDDTDGYFFYKWGWYHLSMFMRTGIDGWDGFHGDSFFSGVAIRLSEDGERYQVATVIA